MTNHSKKNLIILHLESLSNEILSQEEDILKDIQEYINESISYSHFFSSATSSILSMTDLLYGNEFELDDSVNYDNDLRIKKRETSLYEVLENENYDTAGIGYPFIWRDDVNEKELWHSTINKYKWVNKEEYFYEYIRNFVLESLDSKKNFALHIWDLRSHLVYSDPKKEKGINFFDKRSLGYKCINETAKFIKDLLSELGLDDNTIVVGYGDHGDELWTHSLNGGFCHAQEPYTNLIMTPCFIHSTDFEPKKERKLVSLTDLKWTILDLLEINHERQFIHSGINVLKDINEVVFSRNLLANQESDENSSLRKAYSVTNMNYHLIVSDYGLEMYAYKIDTTNHSNLLSFFDLSNEQLIFNERSAWHRHFQVVMTDEQINDIINNFFILCKELKQRVELKNNMISHTAINEFNLENFEKVRKREYLWK